MVARKMVLGQLASVGEGAIGRLAQNPVTHKALEGALQVKERVEKLVNGVESLEQRLAAVEKRLDALEKPKRTTTRKTTSTSKTSPKS
jgi:hypothetical protein